MFSRARKSASHRALIVEIRAIFPLYWSNEKAGLCEDESPDRRRDPASEGFCEDGFFCKFGRKCEYLSIAEPDTPVRKTAASMPGAAGDANGGREGAVTKRARTSE